jgi:hypothetical protein
VTALPAAWQHALYRVALDRGYEEMVVSRLVVRPVLRLLDRAAAAEKRWIAWLGGESPGGRR